MQQGGLPVWQLIVSLILTAFSSLACGVITEESTQKEISDSGVGVSLRSVASSLVSALPMAWSLVCAYEFARALGTVCAPSLSAALQTALTVVFLLIFALAGATVFVYLPRSLGRARSEQYAKTYSPLISFMSLFVPFARLVTSIARRLLRVSGAGDEIGAVSEEDVLDDVEDLDEIDDTQKEMIGNIFELDDVTAEDVMTHRTEIGALPLDATLADVTDIAMRYGYSRLPVFDGSLDNIVGVVYAKDLLSYVGKPSEDFSLRKRMRSTLYVPESCHASDLLLLFKKNKVQFAVVVDEYGGTAGIVTMEDILESIVGDIEDEFDALGLDDVPDTIENDTIGGLLIEQLGRIPDDGEQPTVNAGPLVLTALRTEERRIKTVAVRLADASDVQKDE